MPRAINAGFRSSDQNRSFISIQSCTGTVDAAFESFRIADNSLFQKADEILVQVQRNWGNKCAAWTSWLVRPPASRSS